MLTVNFSQALEKGYGPYTPSLSKLVWHSQTGTLYVITCCVLCQISGLTFFHSLQLFHRLLLRH